MRIFIPVLGFGKAGGHRVLSRLASEWTSTGLEVIFICPKDYHDVYYPTTAEVHYVATLYSSLPNFLKKKILRDLFGLLSLFKYLILNAFSTDIVLANRDLTAYPTKFASLIKNFKGFYYIQAYEPDFYEFTNPLFRKISHIISSFTYKLGLSQVVNSPVYKNYKEINAKFVVPPGLDLSIFFYKDNTVLNKKNTLTIGCIGRSQAWKGTADIIEAVKNLRDEGFDVKLSIAFHIPDCYSAQDWIEVVQPHGDLLLAEFYRRCDIFVAAGKIQYGAFHYPAAESLAVGTTLVSSPYFPANENNSYIFEQCTPQQIAAALKKAISDSDDERSTKSRDGYKSISEISWSNSAEMFLQIFFE